MPVLLVRLRRQPHKPPLPSIFLTNARSITNKMDELKLRISANKLIEDYYILLITETWPHPLIPDVAIELAGRTALPWDRNKDSVTHSLKNCVTGTTGLSVFPDFVAVAIVDEDTVGYFDSSIKRLQLRQQWAENIEEKNMDHDNRELNSFMEDFKQKWSHYMTHFNQSGGIHTLQLALGCQGDGWEHEGYLKYGYDGEDFLTLDMTNFTWIAANPQAAIIKKEWESSETKWHRMQKYVLCVSLLQKAAFYGKNSLERKVPPEVSLLRRDPSSPVTCLATGFFPKGIVVSWQKDGEDLHEDVELLETVPNENGTFQTRSRLTVSPADLKEHKFICIVDHISLEKKIIKAVTEEEIKTNRDPENSLPTISTIIGVVVVILLVAIFGFACYWRSRMKRGASTEWTPLRHHNRHGCLWL